MNDWVKSFICSQLGIVSVSSSVERVIQKTGWPTIDFNRFNRWNESIANEESMLASHFIYIRKQVRGGNRLFQLINALCLQPAVEIHLALIRKWLLI